MHNIIIISAILATSFAAPGYLLEEHPVYHAVPLSAKSTYTQSSQVIDHGSTFVHTPAIQTVIPSAHIKTTITKSNQLVNHGGSAVFHPIHYETAPLHEVYHIPSKSTVTNSKQIVNHGGAALVHAPIVHTSVLHAPVVYHSSPVVALKTGDSAITHQSSTVHETVPVVKSVHLLAVHH